ncbi:dihydrodipicolinate synthase family protein [Salipiger sp.]|uniref:dihydrodipicolinate synthase family protein n=1 Tax=Salipiger sp. TaxID=2078585 RepID=UPI003A9780C3
MHKKANGIVPVMLTPFTKDDRIDWDGLERLVEWYVDNGADTLFAVCQSSEMQRLTLDERTELARRTVAFAAGRLPVIASGHISDAPDDQREELRAMAGTGIDALVLVTNHLDPAQAGTEAFRAGLDAALGWLPGDLPLGLYECPAPFRRLLSDDEFKLCRDSGRFVTLKDVSCDLGTVRRRIAMSGDSGFAVVNANAAIAADAMRAGSLGFSGVFTNFHPDLYAWLYRNKDLDSDLRRRLETFLALAAMAEPMGYPGLAKLYHVRRGTFASAHSRVIDFDIPERFWGVMALLDHIETGTEAFRAEIAAADGASATT